MKFLHLELNVPVMAACYCVLIYSIFTMSQNRQADKSCCVSKLVPINYKTAQYMYMYMYIYM